MPDWHAIAAQIRALIHAQAPPAIDQIASQAPDEALVAAGPVALIVFLIVLFALIGALTGGKAKKARRAAAAERAADDDLPPPPVVTRAPPLKATDAREGEAKASDKRVDAMLEALRRARAPDADLSSREEIRVREEAAQRVLKENASTAKALLAGDVAGAFDRMTEDASSVEKTKKTRAAQVWRDLGIFAEGIDRRRSLQAFEEAFALDRGNFWGAVFLGRLRAEVDKPKEALEAATAALAIARGPREKAIGNAELGDAHLRSGDINACRTAYQGSIDAMRSLARTGARDAQRDLSVCITKLADLEVGEKNIDKARALFEEDLEIARHLASADPGSLEAQRDLIVTLCKLGEITRDKKYWVEASGMVEALSQSGRWPESDAWMRDALKKQIAATP